MSGWGDLGPDSAPSAICTGFPGSIEEMVADDVLVEWAGSGELLLDLGAGVGRNTVALARNFADVVAYDLPNMCEMMRARSDLPANVTVTSDWESASSRHYDVVVIALVLQHLSVESIRAYLSEIRCERLIVNSRTWIDFVGGEVLPLVQERFKVVRFQATAEESGEHYWCEGRPK
jgi:hypothetical protein